MNGDTVAEMAGCELNAARKGTYLVLAELTEPAGIQVNSGRTFVLDKGFYAYAGSALSGLEGRVARHLSRCKKPHWHIDYLLRVAVVRSVICAESGKNAECLIAQALSQGLPSIAGFGCSDCKCTSHLFFSKDLTALTTCALDTFRLHGLHPFFVTGSK